MTEWRLEPRFPGWQSSALTTRPWNLFNPYYILNEHTVSFSTYTHAIKYIVHNSGNDVNVSLDCPTKLGGSSFKTVTVQQIFVI